MGGNEHYKVFLLGQAQPLFNFFFRSFQNAMTNIAQI